MIKEWKTFMIYERNKTLGIFLSLFILCNVLIFPQRKIENKEIPLPSNGTLSVWLVAGPFEQPTFGFGNPGNADKIGEKTIEPYEGKIENGAMTANGKVKWTALSGDSKNFIDFNNSLVWYLPGKRVEKVWQVKAGYACTYINSNKKQDAVLLLGSNSSVRVFLNHKQIYFYGQNRNAVPDNDTVHIKLNKGKNVLLVKIGNSNSNLTFGFFGELLWQWGFYARILNSDYKPLTNCSIEIPETNLQDSFDITSTFFFKKIKGELKQRFDLVINSQSTRELKGELKIQTGNNDLHFSIDKIKFGESRHEIYLSALKSDETANCSLTLNGKVLAKKIKLLHRKHYSVHLVMLSHTDIGYTNPQPIVKELHCQTIDSVLSLCKIYPDFKWTMETVWELYQYQHSRPNKMFMELIKYIKEGRISVSPIYSNPFTGRISEEEMIQSLALAEKYKKEFGIKFNASVYDDVPGQSWFVPEVLKNIGVKFLADGINEVYNNYKLQRNLPKAFNWEGPDGSKIIAYRDEGYNEGRYYGLEKGKEAIEDRLWNRLNSLEAWGYPYNMVLLISAYMDNVGVPTDQYLAAKKWDKEFEYPKIIISNLDEFAKEFTDKYKNIVPTLKGDMTSPWDINTQGEPVRNAKTRWVQHQLLSSQKLLTIDWLLNKKEIPFAIEAGQTYKSLLEFDGHGSGLEYGYGSPKENKITMAFRGHDVNDAYFNTVEMLEKSIYRITKPEESFEGEGIYVFNSLSWKIDAPVVVEFPANQTQQYKIVDLTNGKNVPSFRDGYKLFFIAGDVPSLGFKKYRLIPETKVETNKVNDLRFSSNFIENKFYKISFNPNTGNIKSITDKKTGEELINGNNNLPFIKPLMKIYLDKHGYKPVLFKNITVKVIDERPVRLMLRINPHDSLFKQTDIILWHNLDRIDLSFELNLETLKFPKKLEEYGVAFPFSVKGHKNVVEILGGFANPEKDILPGVDKNAFSIRRTAAQYNNSHSISWASVDNRVIELNKNEGDTSGILISNILNNFPKDWNRNEVKKGMLLLRFSFTNQKGSFDPAFTSKFGWEVNTPLIVRRSWYRSKPSSGSFLSIDNNNVQLLNMISLPGSNAVLLRLKNVNNSKSETAEIKSSLFKNENFYYCDYFGDKLQPAKNKLNNFKIKFNPNQIITVRIDLQN